LQDVVFVAHVLDGPPEAQRVLDEHIQHADGDRAGEHAEASARDNQGDGDDGKQINGG